jgi:hypothetical protein
MSEDPPRPGSKPAKSEADAALEREIRAERKFTLSEAIGRMAGPGAMKGASPVTRKQQAAAEIQECLDRHLPDDAGGGGALGCVLLRQVTESERLLAGLDEPPLAVLAGCVRQLLGSECRLKELVREADVEWARTFDERPRFERDGCAPAPDDPYTLESVRAALKNLVESLPAGGNT